jgi:ADP-heptose:LPS heptosyltransferase
LLAPLEKCGVEFHHIRNARLDAGELPIAVVDHRGQLHDFNDTAALIAQLDLVISVDTVGAHLAAAMGKPAWMLLPSIPDWRWMLDRTDTPWYPTMRLFRQRVAGDWASAIAEVVAEIA